MCCGFAVSTYKRRDAGTSSCPVEFPAIIPGGIATSHEADYHEPPFLKINYRIAIANWAAARLAQLKNLRGTRPTDKR